MIPLTTYSPPAKYASLSKGRTLHLVDVENLLGDPHSSEAAVRMVLARYRRMHLRSGDQVVIAANPQMGVKAKMAWPEALVRWAVGPDGADNALLAEAQPDDIARRFDRLVVASGDHIFAQLVKDVKARGVAVLVVHRRGSLSNDLRRNTVVMALEAPIARSYQDAA
jgi:hypothetical protein